MKLFIIKGYEESIIKNQINKLINIITKNEECDIFNYEYDILDINQLYNNLSSLSLFNKVFIIENFRPLFDNNTTFDIEKFIKKITNNSWSIILTIGDKKIDETSKAWILLKDLAKFINIKKESKQKIENSIKKRFEKNNISFSKESISYFCKLLDYDLIRLNNEIKKFINVDISLTIKNIDLLIANSFEVNTFEICNAILDNNLNKYILALKKYWLSNDYFLLINILAQNLIIARNVKYYWKKGLSIDEISKLLKLNSIRVKILISNKSDLKNINDKINMLFKIHKNISINKYNNSLIKYQILKLII